MLLIGVFTFGVDRVEAGATEAGKPLQEADIAEDFSTAEVGTLLETTLNVSREVGRVDQVVELGVSLEEQVKEDLVQLGDLGNSALLGASAAAGTMVVVVGSATTSTFNSLIGEFQIIGGSNVGSFSNGETEEGKKGSSNNRFEHHGEIGVGREVIPDHTFILLERCHKP